MDVVAAGVNRLGPMHPFCSQKSRRWEPFVRTWKSVGEHEEVAWLSDAVVSHDPNAEKSQENHLPEQSELLAISSEKPGG